MTRLGVARWYTLAVLVALVVVAFTVSWQQGTATLATIIMTAIVCALWS